MSRTCKNCATADPLAFYETQASLYCKACHRAKYFGKGRARRDAAKFDRGECVECHLKVTPENACVFEFDHTRDKKYNVSQMTTLCEAKFKEEIDKCELVCSNCHRIRTRRGGGYSRAAKGPTGRPRKAVEPHTAPSALSPATLDGSTANTAPLGEATPQPTCATM